MSPTDLTIPNLKQLDDDVWTAGQPTPKQLAEAREAGFKSVITLCPSAECGWDERSAVEQLGMHYACVPVTSGGDLTAAAARRLHDELAASPKPAIVHCGSANRVGALFALKAHFVDGQEPDAALAHGRRAGLMGLEATVRRILSS